MTSDKALVGKHTPGPWRKTRFTGNKTWTIQRDDTHEAIANVRTGEEDAEFIVKACNLHAEMLAALKELAAAMRRYEADAEGDSPYMHREMMVRVDAAISKAEGLPHE